MYLLFLCRHYQEMRDQCGFIHFDESALEETLWHFARPSISKRTQSERDEVLHYIHETWLSHTSWGGHML